MQQLELGLTIESARKFVLNAVRDPNKCDPKHDPNRLPFIKDVSARKDKESWTWDRASRTVLFERLNDDFKTKFPELNFKQTIFIEGKNSIPTEWRKGTFFGASMYPDGAIDCGGERLALELDHGCKGSQIRNPLAKAAFAIQIGHYSASQVLLVWEGSSCPEEEKGDEEQKVLNEYKEKWNTEVEFLCAK